MGSPSASLATLRPDLGGSFTEFDLAMDRQGFIGTRVLPVMEVMKQAGPFGKIPIEELLLNKSTERAPRADYPRGDFTFTTDTFACQEHGWEEPVDDRESAMYREYFDQEMVAAQRARDFVMRGMERRISALIFNATTWTGASLTTAVGTEWSTAATATPIANVEAAAQKVYANCGMWPNALVINRKVFRNLRLVTEVKNAIASSGAGDPTKASDITTQMLSSVFDLPYILVGGSTQNTANEGQSASLSPVWSDEYAMVCKIATSNDIQEPCIGRTFHWAEDGSSIGATMESYRDERVRGDVIRARNDTHEKVLYTECGHLLSNITA